MFERTYDFRGIRAIIGGWLCIAIGLWLIEPGQLNKLSTWAFVFSLVLAVRGMIFGFITGGIALTLVAAICLFLHGTRAFFDIVTSERIPPQSQIEPAPVPIPPERTQPIPPERSQPIPPKERAGSSNAISMQQQEAASPDSVFVDPTGRGRSTVTVEPTSVRYLYYTSRPTNQRIKEFITHFRMLEAERQYEYAIEQFSWLVDYEGEERYSKELIWHDWLRRFFEWPFRVESSTEIAVDRVAGNRWNVVCNSILLAVNPAKKLKASGFVRCDMVVELFEQQLYVISRKEKVTEGRPEPYTSDPPEEFSKRFRQHAIYVPAFVRNARLVEHIRDPALTADRYSDQIRYFGKSIARSDLFNDKRAYFTKWPYLSETIEEGSVKIDEIEKGRRWEVLLRTKFRVENAEQRKWFSGTVASSYHVEAYGFALRITGQSGEVFNTDKGNL